ncbi:MAG: TIGR02265 family protein [Sandaracinaceae bacterium]|nr:MAG: TIGR02265 family protein [Sandaracinaceae bacterium]HBQ12533.1 hypothetical protein [Myxococcales bacterium]
MTTMKFRPAMPEEVALPKRRELLAGDETLRGIVFQSVDRAIEKVLGPDAMAAAKEAAGIGDQKHDAMSKYPMADFLRYEEEAARLMATAAGGFDEAVHRIGASSVDTFFDSIAGKTMALLAGKDPTRLLGAAPNGYGLLASYGQRRFRQTSANTGVFDFTGEYLGPVHNLGTFDTALKLVHGADCTIDLDQKTPLDFSFKLTW